MYFEHQYSTSLPLFSSSVFHSLVLSLLVMRMCMRSCDIALLFTRVNLLQSFVVVKINVISSSRDNHIRTCVPTGMLYYY